MKLDGKTTEQLLEMQNWIQDDPDSRTDGGLYLYTPQARKKLDAITRQITYNLAVARKERGDPVVCDGYSGRQTNKR